MDSTRIKRLATGAREQLRREVAGRLDAVLAPGSAESLAEPAAVEALAARVAAEGRERVVDSAAYTWFNRLCALRFMDANDYAPAPAVTPRKGTTLPAVLADAQAGLFDPGYGFTPDVRARVSALLAGQAGAANATEAAYAELLRAVCDHYADAMPFLFSEDAASWLLMPQSLLAEGSILRRVVEEMDDESCKSVEVLGWLYQHYIAERKDEVFAGFKKGRKAGPAEIGPATQLFTPEWIVRYLCENSLGRLWMLNNPTSTLADSMDYYIAPDGEEPHVEVASASDIRVLDPACGSGHILVYAFDLLFAMYEEEGWLPEDIPAMILQNNLRGLEVSGRAAEIALFALMMKARGRDPRFLERGVIPDVRVLEVAELDDADRAMLSDAFLERTDLLDAMAHMSEVGSLFQPAEGDADAIRSELSRLAPRAESGDAFAAALATKLRTMLANVEALTGTYHCVIANPPYMGSSNMNKWLSGWAGKRYPDTKRDFCTCFIEHGFHLTKSMGYSAMVTMESWMFLGSYENMRKIILDERSIVSLVYMNHMVMRIAFNTSATVFMNGKSELAGAYTRVEYKDLDENEKPVGFPSDAKGFYRRSADSFKSIPGTPIAYWASDAMIEKFKYDERVGNTLEVRQGLACGDVNKYRRFWFEVEHSRISFSSESIECFHEIGKRYAPINDGGQFRKWFGNNEAVLKFDLENFVNLLNSGNHLPSRDKYFKSGATWSAINSSRNIALRYFGKGSLFSNAGMAMYAETRIIYYAIALLNSAVSMELLKLISQTLNFNAGDVKRVPVVKRDTVSMDSVIAKSKECIDLSRFDWNSFETSWDFKRHPLV